MMKPEKFDKKAAILTTAEKLFAELGYDGTSTRKIAKESGVNMAMINYYFGSKDGVFQEIITARSNDFNSYLLTINEEKVSYLEKLISIVDGYSNRVLSNIGFHRMTQMELSLSQRPEVFSKIKEARMKNLHVIENIINDGISSGSFRKIDVRMFIATLIGTISHIALSPSKITAGSTLDINIPEDREIIAKHLQTHLKDLITTYLTPQK